LATGKRTARDFGVTADDWHVLQTARPNILLIGSDRAVAGFLDLLLPLLVPPITQGDTATLALPAHSSGTFILRDVCRLDAAGQQRLVDWLTESGHRTQIISTSSSPLYPLVERGTLSAPLYYSLNVIMLTLRDSSAPH
jgi:Sigma-54 interaction domain